MYHVSLNMLINYLDFLSQFIVFILLRTNVNTNIFRSISLLSTVVSSHKSIKKPK